MNARLLVGIGLSFLAFTQGVRAQSLEGQVFREFFDTMRRLQEQRPSPQADENVGRNAAPRLQFSESKPTFSCELARNPLATILCNNPAAAKQDWNVNTAAWATAASLDDKARNAFWEEHATWVKALASACKLTTPATPMQVECVVGSYAARTNALKAKLAGDALAETDLTLKQRVDVQQRLAVSGYFSELPDGQFGPATRQAIRQWQAANRLSQSDFLTVDQRATLVEGRLPTTNGNNAPVGGTTTRTTTSNPPTLGRPVPVPLPESAKVSGLTQLEQLLYLPPACVALKETGRSQMFVRDPFSGRNSPGPACANSKACFEALPLQAATLLSILRRSPLFLGELQKQKSSDDPDVSGHVNLLTSIAKYSQFGPQECNYAYSAIENSMVTIGSSRGYRQRTFESFASLANKWIGFFRRSYADDLSDHEKFVPYAKSYSRAEALQRAIERYKSLYEFGDLEALIAARVGFRGEMLQAEEFVTQIARQTGTLASIRDTIAEMLRKADREPLSKLINDQVVQEGKRAQAEIDNLVSTQPSDRGDASAQIARLQLKKEELIGSVSEAASRLATLNRQEERRAAAVNSARQALATLEQESVQKRLNEQGMSTIGRMKAARDELSKIGEMSILGRPNHFDALKVIDASISESQAIQSDIALAEQIAERVGKLNSLADRRGRRFLDATATAELLTLSAYARKVNQQKLPFSLDERRQLSDEEQKLTKAELRFPDLMDAKEREYLIGQFPLARSKWNFEHKVDKLTDAQSVHARTVTDGDQSRYQIEFICKGEGRVLAISTFEKDRDVGKPIDWISGLSGAFKPVRVRVDSEPVLPTSLVQSGYSNSGLIRLADRSERVDKVVNGSRLVIGDIFAGDQVEVQTEFPETFKRLCSLLLGRSAFN